MAKTFHGKLIKIKESALLLVLIKEIKGPELTLNRSWKSYFLKEES